MSMILTTLILMHSCWDIAHHLWGNPLWPFMPTSSFGCMMFDAVIAIWFIAGAPSIHTSQHRLSEACGRIDTLPRHFIALRSTGVSYRKVSE